MIENCMIKSLNLILENTDGKISSGNGIVLNHHLIFNGECDIIIICFNFVVPTELMPLWEYETFLK